MRKRFRNWDIKIMTYVMFVVTIICVISATVAWFNIKNDAEISTMQVEAASTKLIKVEVLKDGQYEEVKASTDGGDQVHVSFDMPTFSNVTGDSVLAPGVYGTIELYVTPLRKDVVSCDVIRTNIEEWTITYLAADATDEEKEQLKDLLRGHLLFFKTRTGTAGAYTYADVFESDTPVNYALSWDNANDVGVRTKVTIYWCWPYEYADIPDEIRNAISADADADYPRKYFFEPEREASGYDDTRLYDYADTKIGSAIETLQMAFEVIGNVG